VYAVALGLHGDEVIQAISYFTAAGASYQIEPGRITLFVGAGWW